MRLLLSLLLFVLSALPFVMGRSASGEEVVAALSQNRISITANFDGSEIIVFGAIKRETPIPTESPLDVIVTVAGPEQVETIRRKARRYGIWVNVEAHVLGHVPTFYSVVTSRPMIDSLPRLTDALWEITADQRILPGLRGTDERDALLRIRQDAGMYRTREGEVDLIEETLFRTSVALPANLTEGDYTTRIFLLREGEVIDSYGTEIFVRKVGIERWLFNLAHSNGFLYGILAVFVAVIFGWAASETFRLIRRR